MGWSLIGLKFNKYGYEKTIDYEYFSDCTVHNDEPSYYEDAHGNKIFGVWEKLQFHFQGFGSEIHVPDRGVVASGKRGRSCIFSIH